MVQIWLKIGYTINIETSTRRLNTMQLQQKSNQLFETVPKEDYLGLLKGRNPKKVVDYLRLSQEEVARATGIPEKSVRYDNWLPNISRVTKTKQICGLILEIPY
jgi:hypothetical protein